MWEEVIKVAVSNGIWAVLFVALLIYQLKDSATRESKYQKTIEALTERYAVVEDIKEDIEDIKETLTEVASIKSSSKISSSKHKQHNLKQNV